MANDQNTHKDTPEAAHYPLTEERFFGRRKGQSLSARKRELMEDYFPKVALLPEVGEGEWSAETVMAQAKALWVEIGFGKGEHLVWQAEANPDIAMIGCEPYINGVAALVDALSQRTLNNIKVYADDARHVLNRLADASVDRLFLIHPDPWPKSRHAKRRFVNPVMLDLMARVLKRGGEFRLATDHPVYREWALIQMAHRNDFEWVAETPRGWRDRPVDWPETRYARKALEGDAVFLIYRRC